MDQRPATLEKDKTSPHSTKSDTQGPNVRLSDSPPGQVKGMRFKYASGAKPLAGYTIKRGIGIGGFGEVYFALSDAGKEVALKRIQRNLDIELRGVRQCLNLKHVNLISLWDIRTCDAGESWVVMEYVPGDSLSDVIEKHPQGMPLQAVHQWFEETSAGVAYLHERGIVHRDLKPGNIFRDIDEQVVKIGDYGLSKFISCSNRDGQTESVGTFHYMAPEIGKGVYGKEIDIYALGIILFEMLTGRVPFEGESSQEIIMKHLTALPDLAGLNQPYQTVIGKALEKDPHRRYSSVSELLNDLPVDASGQPRTPLAGVAESKMPPTARGKPPIQAMFIGEQNPYVVDDQETQTGAIKFGEVRKMSDAQAQVASSHQPGTAATELAGGTASTAAASTAAASTAAVPISDEPIARVVHGTWHKFVDWWNHANVSTPVKMLILAGGMLLLLVNSAWMLPVALFLALLYLCYYAVRSWMKPTANKERPTKLSKAEKVIRVRYQLSKRPVSDRTSELVGSLVVSSLACLILGFVAMVAGGAASQVSGDETTISAISSAQHLAFFVWAVLTAVIGSWTLLVISKTWEHRNGDATLRRFTMIASGLAIGLLGFLASQFLHLNWSIQPKFDDLYVSTLGSDLFVQDGAPNLVGFLVFFGGLFCILRWWRQADPVRKTRLSFWSVGLCLVWGVVIGQLFHFPLPWSGILAVMISIAVQLAAPWLTPHQKAQLEREPVPTPQ